MKNEIQRTNELAAYLEGFARSMRPHNEHEEPILQAAKLLRKLGNGLHMCGQGYIGCHGGEQCSSDHK